MHLCALYSFATAVSEVTRGTSAGSGGKGHVKSASVSSPGPSAENGAPADPLAPRYQQMIHFDFASSDFCYI